MRLRSDGNAEVTDDCDETSTCWNVSEVDGELLGICSQMCMGNADAPVCPDGSLCEITSWTSLCIIQCDPLEQDCAGGLICRWGYSYFTCFHSTENIGVGEPCEFLDDCAAGLGCYDAELLPDCQAAACCTPYCNLELGDTQCEAQPGTSCTAFFEPAPPGHEQVGVCVAF